MPSCTSNGTNNKIKYNDKTEYEVCSVMEYIENETNGYGGILNTYSCYSFTYIEPSLHSREEYSLIMVCGPFNILLNSACSILLRIFASLFISDSGL